MSLRSFAFLIFSVLLTRYGYAEDAQLNGDLEPVTMMKRINGEGQARVISGLNDAQWADLVKGVESGNRSWLTVASRLHSAADAGASESLTLAAGVALVLAPADVLSILIPEMPVKAVCGLPDLTDPRTDTLTKTIGYLNDRL